MEKRQLITELGKELNRIDESAGGNVHRYFDMAFSYYAELFDGMLKQLKKKKYEGGGRLGELLKQLSEMNLGLSQFNNSWELSEEIKKFEQNLLGDDFNIEDGKNVLENLKIFNDSTDVYWNHVESLDNHLIKSIRQEIDQLPWIEGAAIDRGKETEEEWFKIIRDKIDELNSNGNISWSLTANMLSIESKLKQIIDSLIEKEEFTSGEEDEGNEDNEGNEEDEDDEFMDPEVLIHAEKERIEIRRKLYLILLSELNLSREYVKNLIKYLVKNGKYPKKRDISDWDLKLLRLIGKKYNLEQLSFGEFTGIVKFDLNFLGKKFGNDEEVMNYLRTNTFKEFIEDRGFDLKLDQNSILKVLKEHLNTPKLSDDLKRMIYGYVSKNYENVNGLKFLKLIKTEIFIIFLSFYDRFVKKVDLGLLNSGKFYKFYDAMNKLIFYPSILVSVLAAVKELGVKDDDRIIKMLSRGETIIKILHSNNYRVPKLKDNYADFNFEDSYYADLFLAMMASKWDLNQDVVDKFLNVGLNQKIDELLSGKINLREIGGNFNINIDTFRNNLIEFRQIIANSQEIPYSWKEKIYQVNNDLETILMGDILIKYINQAKNKDTRVLSLNYEMNNGLRFEVLKNKSIEHFRAGAATQCCQRPGGAAEASMLDSFINPLAGVLVLKKDREIISQSYFHHVPADNGYILDNVETNDRLVNKYEINLNNLYANLAKKIQEDTGANYVRCGKNYNKLNNLFFKTEKMQEDPRYFELEEIENENVYSDFDENDHIDLLAPKATIIPVEMKKKAFNKFDKLLKFAERFEMMIRFGV